MSNPITLSNPASADSRTIPTSPPAGPDRIASLPRKCRASASPPLDCMNIRRVPPTAAATRSTYRRRIGERYASTTVVSPRGTSFISGLTSLDSDTWGKPIARARSRSTARERVQVAVQAHHRHRPDPVGVRPPQLRFEPARSGARSTSPAR